MKQAIYACFNIVGADELFFINGGSGAPSGGSTTSNGSSMGVTIGNAMDAFGEGMQTAATVFAAVPGAEKLASYYGAAGVAVEKSGEAFAANASSGSSSGSGGGGSK